VNEDAVSLEKGQAGVSQPKREKKNSEGKSKQKEQNYGEHSSYTWPVRQGKPLLHSDLRKSKNEGGFKRGEG